MYVTVSLSILFCIHILNATIKVIKGFVWYTGPPRLRSRFFILVWSIKYDLHYELNIVVTLTLPLTYHDPTKSILCPSHEANTKVRHIKKVYIVKRLHFIWWLSILKFSNYAPNFINFFFHKNLLLSEFFIYVRPACNYPFLLLVANNLWVW